MENNMETVSKIGEEQLKIFDKELMKYKTGKARTERRIIESENWWKLRNTIEEQKETSQGKDGAFTSRSGWLHNVISNKHADAMAAYPEPNIRPREQGDVPEAKMLSSIIPCIMEQNKFETTYSDVQWQKMKTGTGAYKIVWDAAKNGIGDIQIEKVNLLNVFWEPGITDIQRSRYIFQTEMVDKALLKEKYPQLEGKMLGNSMISSRYRYDDTVSTEDKATVIEVYYHVSQNGRQVLHYCKYVDDVVLYATENMRDPVPAMDGSLKPSLSESGLYDHGMYPYVFDPLFPIEGSPCGYGYVDLCRNPQTEIDLMKTAILKNTMAGAVPRYFSQAEGNITEEEFLDLSKPIVHVQGNVDEASLRRIEHNSLDGNYINAMQQTINELRENSGNTETASGSTSSGVTAASAIAALQEASGKGSRDSTQGAYRAYQSIVEICIELIRQFYDLPRKFRILGQYGAEEYVTYTNQNLQLQAQGSPFGQEMGMRKPVFDVKVSAQKANVYTKVSQNELAMQFFQMGFFAPQMADQALMCLGMMDFDEKDTIMQQIAKQQTMAQKLMQYMQMCAGLVGDPAMVQMIAQDMQQTFGAGMAPMGGGAPVAMPESNAIAGIGQKEPTIVANARQRSSKASQPSEGGVTGGKQG